MLTVLLVLLTAMTSAHAEKGRSPTDFIGEYFRALDHDATNDSIVNVVIANDPVTNAIRISWSAEHCQKAIERAGERFAPLDFHASPEEPEFLEGTVGNFRAREPGSLRVRSILSDSFSALLFSMYRTDGTLLEQPLFLNYGTQAASGGDQACNPFGKPGRCCATCCTCGAPPWEDQDAIIKGVPRPAVSEALVPPRCAYCGYGNGPGPGERHQNFHSSAVEYDPSSRAPAWDKPGVLWGKNGGWGVNGGWGSNGGGSGGGGGDWVAAVSSVSGSRGRGGTGISLAGLQAPTPALAQATPVATPPTRMPRQVQAPLKGALPLPPDPGLPPAQLPGAPPVLLMPTALQQGPDAFPQIRK